MKIIDDWYAHWDTEEDLLKKILIELREIKEILDQKSKKSTCKDDCSVVMNGGLGK